MVKHSLVHKVFLDFFLHAPAKLRTEMIESIREAVVYMAHTHDGARVAMHCLWHGTPKVTTPPPEREGGGYMWTCPCICVCV